MFAVVPVVLVSVMLFNCAWSDTTEASGASVPTTKAEPIGPEEAADEAVRELPQPAARSAAAASAGRNRMRTFRKGLGDMTSASLSALSVPIQEICSAAASIPGRQPGLHGELPRNRPHPADGRGTGKTWEQDCLPGCWSRSQTVVIPAAHTRNRARR